jgi:hypothetical protein
VQAGDNALDTATAIDATLTSCGVGYLPKPQSIWFRWTAPSSGVYAVGVSSTSPLSNLPLAVFRSGCQGVLKECKACANRPIPQLVNFCATQGQEYLIAVGSDLSIDAVSGALSITPLNAACARRVQERLTINTNRTLVSYPQ